MNLKTLLAMLFALSAPFTLGLTVGPAAVLAGIGLAEVRASNGRQGGRLLGLVATGLVAVELVLVALMWWAVATDNEGGGGPTPSDLPAGVAVVAVLGLSAFVTWVLSKPPRSALVAVAAFVVGTAASVGILAAGFAEPPFDPLSPCHPNCPVDRFSVGWRAAWISGLAALGLIVSLAALRWVVTHRRPRRTNDDGEAGIATALDGLRSSADAFRRPEARGLRDSDA